MNTPVLRIVNRIRTRERTNVLIATVVILVLFGCSMISHTREGIKAIYGESSPVSSEHVHATHGHLSSLPTSLLFRQGAIASEPAFREWTQKYLSVDLERSGRLVESENETHIRYQQMYEGIPVDGGMYTAHFDEGALWSATGQLYDDIDIDTKPGITVEETEAFLQSGESDWQIMDVSTLVVLPQYDGEHTEYLLVYRTGIMDNDEGAAAHVYTSAHKTEIVRVEPLMVSALPVGSGKTSDGRTVTFNTQHTSDIPVDTSSIIVEDIPTGYRLMDTDRNLHTRSSGGSSMSDEYNYIPQPDGSVKWNGWDWAIISQEIIEDDNVWEDSPAAVDAHWGMQAAYDYFSNVHGRTGFDGNNGYMQAVVDYDQDVANAFYFVYLPGIFFGDGGTYGRPMTTFDIVAHEFTHGVEQSIVGLKYYEESGSLKEGIADVFMTDAKFHLGQGNWHLEVHGNVRRSFQDPHTLSAPDTYEGKYFGAYSTSFDRDLGLKDLQQHQNSTVLSHWFYLVSEGGEGENDHEDYYDIEPVGRDKMIEVVYKSLFMLHPNSTFMDMRNATTSIIQKEHGKCSEELRQVTNAWYAVGVGEPFCDCFEGSLTGIFESNGDTGSAKFYFKEGRKAVEITDKDGNAQVLYTASTDPYLHVRGQPDLDASTPHGAFLKNMVQLKVPLFAPQVPAMSRKEYIAYRNESRTGITRDEGEYRVYQYRLQEATIWATEEVCLSFADLVGIKSAFGPTVTRNLRHTFFGFPTEFSMPGEGRVRVKDIREHDVPDSYFSG